MKMSSITIHFDLELTNIEVGEIKLDVETQIYIYTTDSEEELIGIQAEVIDYKNETFRGLPIDDFKKTVESYKANGIDLHKAIKNKVNQVFEKGFNKEAFITMYKQTNAWALNTPFRE